MNKTEGIPTSCGRYSPGGGEFTQKQATDMQGQLIYRKCYIAQLSFLVYFSNKRFLPHLQWSSCHTSRDKEFHRPGSHLWQGLPQPEKFHSRNMWCGKQVRAQPLKKRCHYCERPASTHVMCSPHSPRSVHGLCVNAHLKQWWQHISKDSAEESLPLLPPPPLHIPVRQKYISYGWSLSDVPEPAPLRNGLHGWTCMAATYEEPH